MRPTGKPTLRQLSTDQSTLSTLNITRGSKPTDKETRTSQIYSSLSPIKQSTVRRKSTKASTGKPLRTTDAREKSRQTTSDPTNPPLQTTDDNETGKQTGSTIQKSVVQSSTIFTTNKKSTFPPGKTHIGKPKFSFMRISNFD